MTAVTIKKLAREIRCCTRDFVKNHLLASGLVPSRVRVIALRLTGADIGKAHVMAMCFIGTGPLTIGDGSFLNYRCYLDTSAGITIGMNSRLGPGVTIITRTHKVGPSESTRTDRTPGTEIDQPVHIGDNTWIGANVTILPGVTVGNGAVIGAGAVVTKDAENNTLYAGVPACAIRKLPP